MWPGKGQRVDRSDRGAKHGGPIEQRKTHGEKRTDDKTRKSERNHGTREKRKEEEKKARSVVVVV